MLHSKIRSMKFKQKTSKKLYKITHFSSEDKFRRSLVGVAIITGIKEEAE